MILYRKCYLFPIREFNWKDFVRRSEIKILVHDWCCQCSRVAYVLRLVWLLWSTANLFKWSNDLLYATTTTTGHTSQFWTGC